MPDNVVNLPPCFLCDKPIEKGLLEIVVGGVLSAKIHDSCLLDPTRWKEKVEQYLGRIIQIKA